jgi:hypothetical protein
MHKAMQQVLLQPNEKPMISFILQKAITSPTGKGDKACTDVISQGVMPSALQRAYNGLIQTLNKRIRWLVIRQDVRCNTLFDNNL